MLTEQRQAEMAEVILRQGKATVGELAKLFSVSEETVRRDIGRISEDGRIKKVHGGAVALRGLLREEDYALRQQKYVHEKQQIAKRAALQICDNDVVALDSGTCTEALAREIYGVRGVCFLTASLNVASVLAKKLQAGDIEGRVILLGGNLSADGQSTYGTATLAALENYYIDKAFLGATSLSPNGLMVWNEDEGVLSAAMLRRSALCCVLAESEKLGKNSFYRVAGLEELDRLITDRANAPDENTMAALQAAGVEVELV